MYLIMRELKNFPSRHLPLSRGLLERKIYGDETIIDEYCVRYK